jgi:hypothetical protein
MNCKIFITARASMCLCLFARLENRTPMQLKKKRGRGAFELVAALLLRWKTRSPFYHLLHGGAALIKRCAHVCRVSLRAALARPQVDDDVIAPSCTCAPETKTPKRMQDTAHSQPTKQINNTIVCSTCISPCNFKIAETNPVLGAECLLWRVRSKRAA